MPVIRRCTVSIVVLVVALALHGSAFQVTDRLPTQLSDEAFWTLTTELSEGGGSFPSNNFVSNERSYQYVLDELAEDRQPASAYIGVGPEQNFTYLLALKPRIAFIVDIRRQNLIQHLLYKALFELSVDRVEFLSRLFSRPRPENVGRDVTVEALLNAFDVGSADPQRLQDGLQTIKTHLISTHGFTLSRADEAGLERVLTAFSVGGPSLTYDGPLRVPNGIYPSFAEIMRGADKNGMHRGFLATEENFLTIQDLQRRNLVVPIVGDFAGPSALKSVGRYLKDHDATVTAFYTSNVEQYLFPSGTWREFYSNVSTLPVNEKSVFIRGLIRSAIGAYSPSPSLLPTSRYETALFPIGDLVSRFTDGTIQSYLDILGAAK